MEPWMSLMLPPDVIPLKHTDRYLHFQSHHLMHILYKEGIDLIPLHHSQECITLQKNDLAKDEAHLLGALKQNGYPPHVSALTLCSSQTPPHTTRQDTRGREATYDDMGC